MYIQLSNTSYQVAHCDLTHIYFDMSYPSRNTDNEQLCEKLKSRKSDSSGTPRPSARELLPEFEHSFSSAKIPIITQGPH